MKLAAFSLALVPLGLACQISAPAEPPALDLALEVVQAAFDAKHAAYADPNQLRCGCIRGAEVRGLVVDGAGEPIAGATVQLNHMHGGALQTSLLGRPLGQLMPQVAGLPAPDLERLLELPLPPYGPVPMTVTDAEGRFRLRKVRQGQAAEGWPSVPSRQELFAAKQGMQVGYASLDGMEDVEIQLAPLRLIEVELRMPDGSVPERALVAITRVTNHTGLAVPQMHTWSAEAPSYNLESQHSTLESITLQAFAGEPLRSLGSYAASAFKSEAFEFQAGSIPEVLQLVLEPRLGVLGQVLTDGDQTTKPRVRARRLVDGVPVDPAGGWPDVMELALDADHCFLAEVEEPASYRFELLGGEGTASGDQSAEVVLAQVDVGVADGLEVIRLVRR